jgi:hypothetical protein
MKGTVGDNEDQIPFKLAVAGISPEESKEDA